MLPPTDAETMDWISEVLDDAGTGAPVALPPGPLSLINFNLATEYQEDLGFYVAVDGACRLSWLLPTAALISFAPPGSLYQVRDMCGCGCGG